MPLTKISLGERKIAMKMAHASEPFRMWRMSGERWGGIWNSPIYQTGFCSHSLRDRALTGGGTFQVSVLCVSRGPSFRFFAV